MEADHIQQLAKLRDELRQARAALKQDQAAFEHRVDQVLTRLRQERNDLATKQRQTADERQRLGKLRLRLKKRWHRHWLAERAAMERQEAEIESQRQALRIKQAQLQEDRSKLERTQMRLNTELEIGRRQLRLERDQLRTHRAELDIQAQSLQDRQASLASAQLQMAEEKEAWHNARQDLEREVAGLEERAQNHRLKLAEMARQDTQISAGVGQFQASSTNLNLPASSSCPADTVAPDYTQWQMLLEAGEQDLQARLRALDEVAQTLADQRLVLAEECQRFVMARDAWAKEHESATAELESLHVRMQARERMLQVREKSCEQSEQSLKVQAIELSQARIQIEATRTALSAGAFSWQSERDRLVRELRAREDIVEQRFAALTDLRQRWQDRRRRQLLHLKDHRAACESLRTQYTAAREDWVRRSLELAQQERVMAERALSLEQAKQQWLAQSHNPAAAEKQLSKLRKHWAGLSAKTQRLAARERQWLDAEAARLEESHQRLLKQSEELLAREAEFNHQQAEWEQRQSQIVAEDTRLRQELRVMQFQQQQYEHQMQRQRDELENLARLLLQDGQPEGGLALGQAA